MPYKNKDLTSRWIFGDTPAERRWWFNRENAIERSRERLSIPTLKTCMKYKFTKEELQGIFDALIETIEKQYPNDELPNIPSGEILSKLDIIVEDSETESESEGYTTDTSELSYL
tara:strand:+ start:89 stop:433 length:345 start_codon:yes stop_codon:yes gene_type:complete